MNSAELMHSKELWNSIWLYTWLVGSFLALLMWAGGCIAMATIDAKP